jgi:hypothetical protein
LGGIVNDDPILEVGVCSDANGACVPSQGGSVPETDVFSQSHIPHHRGVFRRPDGRGELRGNSIVGFQQHDFDSFPAWFFVASIIARMATGKQDKISEQKIQFCLFFALTIWMFCRILTLIGMEGSFENLFLNN